MNGPIPNALASARLVVLPSRWQEPAGLAALEAMARGTPVIAYRGGGLAEYVADSCPGVVVPPAADRLVAETASLYGDEATWEGMSTSGLEAVETTHSPDRSLCRGTRAPPREPSIGADTPGNLKFAEEYPNLETFALRPERPAR